MRGVEKECLCPPNIHMLKPYPQHGSICWGEVHRLGRWWDHKGGTLMNAISASTKKSPVSSFTPPALWRHREKTAIYDLGSKLSPDTEQAGTILLDFPALRTGRNKFLMLVNHPVYDILVTVARTNQPRED